VDGTIEALPSVLWDAVVLPGGAEALPALCADGRLLEFIRDQYRHCKPMLVLGRDAALLRAAGIPLPVDADDDPGLVFAGEGFDDGDDDDRIVDDGAAEGEVLPEPLPGVPAAQAKALLEQFVAAIGRHRHFERELDPPAV
jgi:catalase